MLHAVVMSENGQLCFHSGHQVVPCYADLGHVCAEGNQVNLDHLRVFRKFTDPLWTNFAEEGRCGNWR